MIKKDWINNFKLAKEINMENRFRQLLANCFGGTLTYKKLDDYRLFIDDLRLSNYMTIYNSDSGVIVNLKTTDKEIILKMETLLKVYGC